MNDIESIFQDLYDGISQTLSDGGLELRGYLSQEGATQLGDMQGRILLLLEQAQDKLGDVKPSQEYIITQPMPPDASEIYDIIEEEADTTSLYNIMKQKEEYISQKEE